MTDTELIQTLAGLDWFAPLPADLVAMVAARGKVGPVARDQWIYAEGDRQIGLHAVLAGAFRSYVSVDDSRDVLIGLLGPGHVFGQVRCLGGAEHPTTVIAHTDSVLFSLHETEISSVIARFPAFQIALAQSIGGYFNALIRRQGRILSLPPAPRLAADLLYLDQELAGDVSVSQADLAEMLGLSRKTVNGLLRQWQQEGIVRLGYSAIRIECRNRLARIADQLTMRP